MQHDIAVIGMVCRVPGAENVEAFWDLLAKGQEGIRSLTKEEIATLEKRDQPHFVAAGGFIDGIDLFDASLFAFSAREATLMDPQHRLWLQACAEALDITGQRGVGQAHVGVFASTGPHYYLNHLLSQPDYHDHHQAILLGNAADCLATRVSYALNLSGPSMTIQCGCSSSLVALHQARLALLAKQCDSALVGGICLTVPHYQGYAYTTGGFASPDGHCRPFSDDAAGTVFASGYGVVVLKRLADALAEGDTIYAVIKGSAINNDGNDKASFTAPSVNGQAAVIAKALRVANLTANDIQYIEAHGTGTPIGDPIELAALQQAFKQSVNEMQGPYTIGSVKANVGHLDVAAGIVSFIKTCLMLHHQTLLPQPHFRAWNPACLGAEKYFRVNQTLSPWSTQGKRRAGVSAFGFGGTNAHVVVEEAPPHSLPAREQTALSRLIVLSAPSSERLLAWVQTLRNYLQRSPAIALEALAYTLQVGRQQLPYRIMISVQSVAECVQILGRLTEADIVATKMSGEVEVSGKTEHEILEAWSNGKILHWKKAYAGFAMRKIPLPSAPLQLESYWAEKSNTPAPKKETLNERADINHWLYQAVWQEKRVTNDSELDALQPVLIFSCAKEDSVTDLIQALKQRGIPYLVVSLGDTYKKLSDVSYEMDFLSLGDYQQLEKSLIENQHLPQLCLLNVEVGELNATSEYPLTVLFHLIKQAKLMRHIKQLTTLVRGMESLSCRTHSPEAACLIAFNRGIGQEFPNIKTQLIDLDPAEKENHAKQVLASLCSSALTDNVVWRGNKCWQTTYQLQSPSLSKDAYFKKHGIYLITGGLGDVASVHVDFLAGDYQATCILLSRTPLPPPLTWPLILSDDKADKKLKQKIARLQKWQDAGYAIHTHYADVTDKEAMHAVCEKITAEIGPLDGIVHIAGAGSDMHYKVLAETDWSHCWKLFAPKLEGLAVLSQLASTFSISNCLVISSISSVLTGIGLSAYGATHNVLDAMVMKHYPQWRIMNWDAWNFHQEEKKQHGELGAQLDKLAIKPTDGLHVLRQAFSQHDWQQVFISSADLSERHRYWAKRGFLEKMTQTVAKHPRPRLPNEYSAPLTALQQQLADVWQVLLGIEKVGIHDSFFELGGHSLLALELVSRLQNEFQYTSSVIDLFEAPTIAQLASKIQPATLTHSIMLSANERVKKQLAARRIKK